MIHFRKPKSLSNSAKINMPNLDETVMCIYVGSDREKECQVSCSPIKRCPTKDVNGGTHKEKD